MTKDKTNKRSVAIVGASRSPAKFGHIAVRAFMSAGFEVFPINPQGGEIAGCTAYRSLSELPVDQVDWVSMYLPPQLGLTLLDEIAALHPDEFWLNPGSESPELVRAAEERGLNVVQACSIIAIGRSPAEFR